ncbi:transcription initiation factor IIA large subunit isoform X2 [Capsicum annuum]|uniref:transcription initiation factor IIA large subunit isoform X2 n=1 Tax=Capsicum annuum TaxID=4072 RepID=UPI0007BF008E|nr:transcription initiation factor IIA large subunit isoform X2 [Capsicum annuum]
MASSTTSNVYIHVIEDVINKVRDEFVNNGGPGETILNELQALWEMKMVQAEAIFPTTERNSAAKATPGGPITTPVHDLNMPYEGGEEYETPTADILFPPTPLQTPLPGTAQTPLPGTVQTPLPGTAQTPLPGTADSSSLYNIPTGGTPFTPSDYSPLNDTGVAAEVKTGPGRPSPFMPPSPWLNQRPPLDVNVAYVEGREEGDRGTSQQPMTQDFFMNSAGKRKREDFASQYHNGGYIPQQDGAADTIYDNVKTGEGSKIQLELVTSVQAAAYRIPQSDGPIPDAYDDALSTPNIYYQGVVNEDYNIVNTPAPHDMQAATPAPVPQNDDVDDDDEPLNENDDDELDDVDQGEDLNTAHLVLAQFDKVTRTKSRWKCTLKDGIMHINNKDILFNKANGEFDF